MLAAIAHPPHLKGIAPWVTASNYHENWTYQGGAFEQGFNESWTSGLVQDTLDHVIRANTNFRVGSAVLPLNNYPVFNLKAPKDGAELTGVLAPYFLDWLAHPTYDDYWKQWSIEENYQNIDVPALTMAAWYDIFQGGSLLNYQGLRDHAATEEARKGQRLLIAIGGHAGSGRLTSAPPRSGSATKPPPSTGTTTSSSASRTSSPTPPSPSATSPWASTSGATPKAGRQPRQTGPGMKGTSFTRRTRQTVSPATADSSRQEY
jgi:predicted acyl esterase